MIPTATPAIAAATTYSAQSTQAAGTFTTAFSSSISFEGTYLFDVELWSGGTRVFQDFETRTLHAASSTSLTRNLPSGLAGSYTVKAGVFSADWSTKYLWSDAAGSVTVAPLSFVAVSTVTSSQFQTVFTATQPMQGQYLFDVELWNGNNRAFQYFDTVSVAGSTTFTLTRPLASVVQTGTYTARAGVFTPNWATKYFWSDNSGRVSVPGTAVAPATTTVPPTTTTTTSTAPSPTTTTTVLPTTSTTTSKTLPPTTTTTVPATTTTLPPTTTTTSPAPTTTTTVAPTKTNIPPTTTSTTTSTTVPAAPPAPAGPAAFTATGSLAGNAFRTVFTANAPLAGTYLFDIELWNGNTKVYQYFETQTMSGVATASVTKTLPPAIAAGTFTTKAGVFSTDWSTKYFWSDNTGTVTVASAMPASFAPSATITGSTLQAVFTTSTPLNGNYLFDVELWNGGARVYQFYSAFPVSGSDAVSITRPLPSSVGQGTYTTKMGVFSPDWSAKYLWSDNADTVTIGSATNQIASSAQRSGATIAATFSSPTALNGSYKFNMELWTRNGVRVLQYSEIQTVSNANSASIKAAIPAALGNDTYTIRTGVFSADGKTALSWNDSAGLLTVTSPEGAPTSATGPAGPAGPTGTWRLAFGDEFNGATLDATKWLWCSQQMYWAQGHCMGHGQELQNYSAGGLSMADFTDGSHGLRITATNTGSKWSFGHDSVSAGAPSYASGMISTSPNTMGISQPGYQPYSFTYGLYEVRMRVPAGQGLWPAAWMFPDDNIGPAELDLAEVLGPDARNYMTIHHSGGESMEASTGRDLAGGMHTYGMDWQPDHVSWYIDGILARTDFTNASNIPTKPMYMMLNLAVGGQWPGAPDGSTPFPATMDIDWVRVWQHL